MADGEGGSKNPWQGDSSKRCCKKRKVDILPAIPKRVLSEAEGSAELPRVLKFCAEGIRRKEWRGFTALHRIKC